MSATATFEKNVTEVLDGCEQTDLPCAAGTMPFRVWHPCGDQLGGELLVLFHGGSGSWTHWIRNIPVLSSYYEVVVPDLPGLGDAAALTGDYQPEDAAAWVTSGLTKLLGPRRFHCVAFSWGCVLASLVAKSLGSQVKSLMLVGAASVGEMPRRLQMKPLIPRHSGMSLAEVLAANRENLARLMISDPRRIDDFAVYLQTENTRRSRFKSPRFASGRFVLDALSSTKMPLLALYGAFDAVAVPNLDARESAIKSVRSDALFEVVPEVGHWLPYEDSKGFNDRCMAWIESNLFA